jgi:hypothetical protein
MSIVTSALSNSFSYVKNVANSSFSIVSQAVEKTVNISQLFFNKTKDGLKILAPLIISSAICVFEQDHRVQKIATGVGLIGSGIFFLRAGNLKNVTRPSKICRILGGVASIGAGIYFVTSAIVELALPFFKGQTTSSQKSDSSSKTEIESLNPSNKATTAVLPKRSDSLNKWKNKPLSPETYSGHVVSTDSNCGAHLWLHEYLIANCPQGRELLEEIEKDGPFTIKCAQPSEMYDAPAMTEITRRVISISPRHIDVHTAMTFELLNLRAAKKFLPLILDPCNHAIDRYEYSIKKSTIEWENLVAQSKLARACKDLPIWDEHQNTKSSNSLDGKDPMHDWSSAEKYVRDIARERNDLTYMSQYDRFCSHE